MAGPVRITVRYDESLRPTGRGRTNREKRAAYDRELRVLISEITGDVQRRLNTIEKETESPTRTGPVDIAIDSSPFTASTRQPHTLFVEVSLNANGPYQANSDYLRTKLAGDVLCWLGYHPRLGDHLEINLMFVPMSGMRVLFNGRSIRDSWGEATEPNIGDEVPAT
jgi:hypothetical protein